MVLADVPPERKPERGYIRMLPPERKPERGYVRMLPQNEKPERGHVRQNHPFTKPPSFLPVTLLLDFRAFLDIFEIFTEDCFLLRSFRKFLPLSRFRISPPPLPLVSGQRAFFNGRGWGLYILSPPTKSSAWDFLQEWWKPCCVPSEPEITDFNGN